MLLLLLALMDEDGGSVLRTLARVKRVSLNELARRADVNKSNLIRYINGVDGGYLSELARKRTLAALGWIDEGLSNEVVHQLFFEETSDVDYVLRVIFGGRLRLRLLGTSTETRQVVHIGSADQAPVLIRCPVGRADLVNMLEGLSDRLPGEPVSTDQLQRVLADLLSSVDTFKKAVFESRRLHPVVPRSGSFDTAPIRQFFELGFTIDDLDAILSNWLNAREAEGLQPSEG